MVADQEAAPVASDVEPAVEGAGQAGAAMRAAAWIVAQLSVHLPQPDLQRYRDACEYARWQGAKAAPFVQLLGPFLPASCDRVLDLGCGHGGETAYYATTLVPAGSASVFGVDFEQEKLKLAVADGRSRARYLCADITSLPIAGDEFDVAVSRDGFEHFMQPESVLREVNRVLRPGGRLVVCFAPYFGAKGPHLGNFVPLPYAHLFFSIPTLARAAELVAAQRSCRMGGADRREIDTILRRDLVQALHGINRITLRRWERLLLASANWKLAAYRKFCGRRLHRPLLALGPLEELVASAFTVLEKAPGSEITPRGLAAAQDVSLPHVIYQ